MGLSASAVVAIALFWCSTSFCEGAPDDEPTSVQSNDPGTTKRPSLIRFAALVQFSSGPVDRIDSQRMRSTLEFKTPIYEGDRFVLGDGAVLKLVSRNDCVAVIYGGAQGLAPEMEKPWRLKAPATRWICPAGAHDTVVINGARFSVGGEVGSNEGGELFIDGERLLVLSGHVELVKMPGALPRLAPLVFTRDGWSRETPEPPPSSVWRMNQKRKPPVESFSFAMASDPPPPKPEAKKTRFILGPTGGSGSMSFDKGQLDKKGLSVDGARLQMQRKRGNGSLIALVEFGSAQENSGNCQNGCPETNAHGNFFNLQLGYRFNHDRWWSPFVRGGGGVNHARVFVNTQGAGNFFSSDVDYEFYMLSLAAGFDAYYSPRWLGIGSAGGGFYGGVDIDAARSLGRGARAVKNQSSSGSLSTSLADEPWGLTTFNLQLMLGLMLLF